MNRGLRLALLGLMRSAGVFGAWRSLHRWDIAILMLHGTADPKRPSLWSPLRGQPSPERLDRCLGVLRGKYRFLTLEEAVAVLQGKKPPVPHGMCVTLDDGYRSNLVDALPVFRKHGVPVTVFLPVAHIEKRLPLWFDRLDYALQAAGPDGRTFRVGDAEFRFAGEGRDGLAGSYAAFRKLAKRRCPGEEEFQSTLEEVISHFEGRSKKKLSDIFEDDPWSALLDWEEIRTSGNGLLRFGSHTMDHYRVGRLEEDALRSQFLESRRRIEERTGRPCRHVAYPDGDCSEAAKRIAAESGYEAGLTTREGLNRIGCDCMELRRIAFPWTSDETELLAYAGGLSEALSRRGFRNRQGEVSP